MVSKALLKDDITGVINPASQPVKQAIYIHAEVPYQDALDGMCLQLPTTELDGDSHIHSATKGPQVGDVRVGVLPILMKGGVRATGGGDKVFEVNRGCCYFTPHELRETTVIQKDLDSLNNGAVASLNNSIGLGGVCCGELVFNAMFCTVSLPQLIAEL